MAAAIGLRTDYTTDDLRRLAKASRDAKQTRRLLALSAIYGGGSRTDAARIGGVGLQVVRDWVLRFNSSGPAGLIDRKAAGKAALLTAEHRSALAQAVEDGPVPWRDGVVRWRLVDLAAWLREEFYQSALKLTHEGDSRGGRVVIHHGEQREVLHGGGARAPVGLLGG